MSGWRMPGAWWPSLLLISIVPAWFYCNGWNGGQGQAREAVGMITAVGQQFRLWRQAEGDGQTRWCAEPLNGVRQDMVHAFRFPTADLDAEFDAGLYCATAADGDHEAPTLLLSVGKGR